MCRMCVRARAYMCVGAHASRDVICVIVSFSPGWMDSSVSPPQAICGLSLSHSDVKCFTL